MRLGGGELLGARLGGGQLFGGERRRAAPPGAGQGLAHLEAGGVQLDERLRQQVAGSGVAGAGPAAQAGVAQAAPVELAGQARTATESEAPGGLERL